MPSDGNKGAFSADIPEDAIASALAAVEKRAAVAAPPEDKVDKEDARAGDRAAAPSEVEQLRRTLEMSQEMGRKVFAHLKDEHDLRLRAAADLENYRKRVSREKDEMQRYAVERLVKDILPVLDNLDRALATATADHPLTTGIAMTRRMLEDSLGRFGAKGFSAVGQPFDPRLHEALMTVTTADHPPGTVIEEQQRGFFLHDRLLRPAAVVVAAAPPEAAPDAVAEAPPASPSAPDEER